jgi:hypothetical protein
MHHARLGAALLLIALPLAALAQTAAAPPPAAPPPAALVSPELKEARQKARAACAGDMQRLCGSVQRGGGAVRSCMREHRAELSPECKSARSDLRALRRKAKG